MIGRTLSHYEITDKLGAGGMGEVYLARDLSLGRLVALKVLPVEVDEGPSRLKRLEREARALAALDHPNIVTIYSVEEVDGVLFLTMAYVRGKRLAELIPKEGMPIGQLLELAVALADALRAAHDQGIIHRDLKPANIMVDEENRLRVLDFGLARIVATTTALPTASTLEMEDPLTRFGAVMGTVPYMSPEQAEGKPVDARSDQFSFGSVLYEMATGRRPFSGDTAASMISSILRDTPSSVTDVRPEIPRALQSIIARCLEKSPEGRFPSTRDLYDELAMLQRDLGSRQSVQPISGWRPRRPSRITVVTIAVALLTVLAILIGSMKFRSAPESGQSEPQLAIDQAQAVRKTPMIVVLPFENLGQAEDDYFAEGMSEEITGRLAMVSGLGVISRSSAKLYRDRKIPIKQVGEELGVDYVLEGTVRWAKSSGGVERVRITPQLIRVADDRQLWADNVELPLEDIFAVQTSIATNVVAALGVTILGSEQTAMQAIPTENLAAYEAYLSGRDFLSRFNTGEAIRLLGLAVERDPQFVEARALLASAYARHYFFGGSDESARLSEAALEEAMRRNPGHPGVRLAEAVYRYYVERDFAGALGIVEPLARERPNDAEALSYVGAVARRLGRWEQSTSALERALELDPRNVNLLFNLTAQHTALQHYEKANAFSDRCIDVAPEEPRCYRDKALNEFYWKGDTAAARAIAARGPRNDFETEFALIRFDQLDRSFESARSRLDALQTPANRGELYKLRIAALIPYAAGDLEHARSEARRLVSFFEGQGRGRSIMGATDLAALATFHAILGERERALESGERALVLSEDDLAEGPNTWFMFAETSLIAGETDRAIEIVDRVLSTPYLNRPSHHWYRLDPLWDPVRDDPRFQAVLSKHTPPGEG